MMPRRAIALLVGRTNVGKSTLFNRLNSSSRAIVNSSPGTTRDRTLGLVNWRGTNFWLSDTPGFINVQDDITKATTKQLINAIPEARIILFVIDGQIGITNLDLECARLLRRLKIPVVLVINKIDAPRWRAMATNNTLGFKEIALVSAKNGSGVGDLLDIVIKHLPPTTKYSLQFTLGLIGRTNVGKSSLFNLLLQTDRSLVLPSEHTTRDRQLDYLRFNNINVEVIDTAGIRRQLPRAEAIEKQSVAQSFNTISQVNISALVLDGSRDLSWQDQRLAGLITESGRSCMILINKADLVTEKKRSVYENNITSYLPMLSWASRLWVSALANKDVPRILKTANHSVNSWRKQLNEKEQVQFLDHLRRTNPTKRFPLTKFMQTGIEPPQFTLHITTKEQLPAAISQSVERELRRKFDFTGSPIRVYLEGVTRGTAGKKLWVRPHKPAPRHTKTTG